MPPDWKPPAPAWSASFAATGDTVVMGYFGTQINPSVSPRNDTQIREFLFTGSDAPANDEAATYVDRAGFRTLISSAYWTDPARYESWQRSSGFAAWWNDPARLHDQQGYFREILTVSPERFETIFSRNCLVGVANTGHCPQVGPIREHHYWGSMRDRILASSDDELRSEYGERLPRLGSAFTLSRRLRVTIPKNLAVIRSGQDLTNCVGPELAQFTESVQPALLEANQFSARPSGGDGMLRSPFCRGDGPQRFTAQEDFRLGLFPHAGASRKMGLYASDTICDFHEVPNDGP